jgi:hypothetical protein
MEEPVISLMNHSLAPASHSTSREVSGAIYTVVAGYGTQRTVSHEEERRGLTMIYDVDKVTELYMWFFRSRADGSIPRGLSPRDYKNFMVEEALRRWRASGMTLVKAYVFANLAWDVHIAEVREPKRTS